MNTQGFAGTRQKAPSHTWVGSWAAARPLHSVSSAVKFVGPLWSPGQPRFRSCSSSFCLMIKTNNYSVPASPSSQLCWLQVGEPQQGPGGGRGVGSLPLLSQLMAGAEGGRPKDRKVWGWGCSPWGPVVWGIANVDSFSHRLCVDALRRWPLILGHTPLTTHPGRTATCPGPRLARQRQQQP